MIQIGDRVQVGPAFAWGSVVDIIPANEYREAIYLIQFDPTLGSEVVTLTPSPDRSWIDASKVYGPFIDQNIGWD